MGQTTPIFKLFLHFDLNYIPVKFNDCIVHSYGAMTLTKCFHKQTYQFTFTDIQVVASLSSFPPLRY